MYRLSSDAHTLFSNDNLKSLFNAGVHTVEDFVKVDINKITASSNFSYKDVIYLKKYLVNKNAAVIRNGLNYYKELLSKTCIVSSQINSLDVLLEGGFLTGQIYEICGLPSSGKTQLCMTISKNLAISNKKSYYLDTKNDLRGKRLYQMLKTNTDISDEQIPDIMSHILIKQIFTKYELISSLYGIKEEILTSNLKLRLLIIDSLPALYQDGFSSLNETNGALNHLAKILQFLAVECHLVIIVINILSTWNETDFNAQSQNECGFIESVSLGKYWFNVPNVRLIMRKENNTSNCEVFKSYDPDVKNVKNFCKLIIKNEGVT